MTAAFCGPSGKRSPGLFGSAAGAVAGAAAGVTAGADAVPAAVSVLELLPHAAHNHAPASSTVHTDARTMGLLSVDIRVVGQRHARTQARLEREHRHCDLFRGFGLGKAALHQLPERVAHVLAVELFH